MTVDVLLLTDPDLPAELADRLADELPALLREHVSDRVDWRVDAVLNPLAGDEQVDVSTMLEVVGERMPDLGWDYGICLTDLPRRAGRRPVAAEVSASAGVALVSLPALGSLRLYPRVRSAVVELIAELHCGDGATRSALGRPEPGPSDGTLFVVPGARGHLRLLAGMVRANRPWRVFLGLSKALAGVFAAAVFALLTSDAWRIASSLGPLRQALIAVVSVATLVVWLVVDHELWERPSRGRAVLYNAATVLTLGLGVVCLYAVSVAVILLAVVLLLDPAVVGSTLGHPPGRGDYAAIVAFTASLAMVGGALGAGLEDDAAVRQATYGERQRRRQQAREAEQDERAG
jgi:hypothetical protein